MTNYFVRHSYLYRVGRRAMENTAWLEDWGVRLGLTDASPPTGQAGRSRRRAVPAQFLVYERQVPKSIHSAWGITEALTVALKEEATAIDSELLVFYVPLAVAVQADTWRRTKWKYGLSEKDWNLRQVEAELGRICRTRGIAMLPTIDRFAEEAKRLRPLGKRVYERLGLHWTREGHQFAAELLAEYVSARHLELGEP